MENIWISSWKHCDFFGKADLVILGILSVYSWYIMIEKILTIRDVSKKNKIFVSNLLYKKEIKKIPCPLYSIVHQLLLFQRFEKNTSEKFKEKIEKLIMKEQKNLEKNLTTLATITAVAPFLGLLGTVWGLLLAFTNMAIKGSSSIRVVAGGVAEALITTVLGLLVAIPSAVGYNYLRERIQTVVDEMEFLIPEIEDYLKEKAQSSEKDI
ncbi:MAG: MotA/TolQ/ExbB proton channel family protein [Candidatus Omnitrophica bacterium]|nr:MotA/TolQ/ExbB proton channel family protein [Candidatus Omnitrophota bacterium]MCM8807591.1 MotA/TolQ/ExbB proton channel family protein [Candidatus Omnitrophota bacterium]